MTTRRRSDVHVWEKRLVLYLTSALVGLCAVYLFDMKLNIAILANNLQHNGDIDVVQTENIKTINTTQQGILIIQKTTQDRIVAVEKDVEIISRDHRKKHKVGH